MQRREFHVELERLVTVSNVRLSFPFDGNRRYRVEISDDSSSRWKLISDQTKTANDAKAQPLSAINNARGLRAREHYRHATPCVTGIGRTRGLWNPGYTMLVIPNFTKHYKNANLHNLWKNT